MVTTITSDGVEDVCCDGLHKRGEEEKKAREIQMPETFSVGWAWGLGRKETQPTERTKSMGGGGGQW